MTAGLAEWEDEGTKLRCRIFWKSVDDWAALVQQFQRTNSSVVCELILQKYLISLLLLPITCLRTSFVRHCISIFLPLSLEGVQTCRGQYDDWRRVYHQGAQRGCNHRYRVTMIHIVKLIVQFIEDSI